VLCRDIIDVVAHPCKSFQTTRGKQLHAFEEHGRPTERPAMPLSHVRIQQRSHIIQFILIPAKLVGPSIGTVPSSLACAYVAVGEDQQKLRHALCEPGGQVLLLQKRLCADIMVFRDRIVGGLGVEKAQKAHTRPLTYISLTQRTHTYIHTYIHTFI